MSCKRLIALGLLMMAAALLWVLGNAELPSAAAPSVTPMPTAAQTIDDRTLREQTYAADVAALQALIASADGDAKQQAQQQLAAMIANHRTELTIGAALEEMGFKPTITVCENGALSVFLSDETLTATQSAQILSLCAAHVDFGAENIRIVTGER